MVEGGQYFGFALKARETLGILGECGRDYLDRYIAVQLGVACAIDFAHPACTDRREDFVGSQTSPHGKGHGYWINSTPQASGPG
jgi:hypothetical protein